MYLLKTWKLIIKYNKHYYEICQFFFCLKLSEHVKRIHYTG